VVLLLRRIRNAHAKKPAVDIAGSMGNKFALLSSAVLVKWSLALIQVFKLKTVKTEKPLLASYL
jgi:hypothetical protein